jgi:hypothetical protein
LTIRLSINTVLGPTNSIWVSPTGIRIRAIQEALGHKSIAMTVRYSHLSPDFIQDAVDRLAPPQEEESAENRTDTTTDTSELESMETGSKSVH